MQVAEKEIRGVLQHAFVLHICFFALAPMAVTADATAHRMERRTANQLDTSRSRGYKAANPYPAGR